MFELVLNALCAGICACQPLYLLGISFVFVGVDIFVMLSFVAGLACLYSFSLLFGKK